MRKLFTIIIFSVLSLIFFAFNSQYLQQNDTYQDEILKAGGDDPTKDHNYQTYKKNFHDAYVEYVNNKSKGINTPKPVDPSGYFEVDEQGKFNLKEKYRTQGNKPGEIITNNNPNGPKIVPGFDHNSTTNIQPPKPKPDLVNTYTWSQTSGTYSAISGGTVLAAIGAGWDDNTYLANPIGFTFTFDGASYTTFGLDCNGFIIMGSGAITNSYCIIQSASNTTVVAPFGADLIPNSATSGEIRYQTLGVSPNRQLVIQWANVRKYGSVTTDNYNFQIILNETSNTVQFVYGSNVTTSTLGPNTCTDAFTDGPGVGLANSCSDFITRSVVNGTNTWASSSAGVACTDVCQMQTSNVPASGLTWTFTPPVASNMSYISSNTVQVSNGVGVQAISGGAVNQPLIQVQVVTSGTLNPFSVTSFSLGTNGSTNPVTDITNAKVYYTGTSSVFATTTLVGTTVSPNGTFTLSGSQVLSAGTNYFWVTYDLPGTATYLDLLDAQCNTITGSGTMGTVVPTTTAPAGTRFVDKYCDGQFTTNSQPFLIYISNVTFGTINNSTAYDPNANYPYAYSFYQAPVPNVSQGTTYSISVSVPSTVNSQGISVYVDWNQNGTFTDVGEYFNLGVTGSGGPTTLTGNIAVPIGATLGNTRMRVRDNFSTAPLSSDACTTLTYGEIEDYTINVTPATNMTYISSTCTQSVVSGFCKPATSLQILGIQVVTSGALTPLSATSFTLNTNGSTNPGTDLTNAKLWYTGLSSTFATTAQVGSTFNGPIGSFVINGSQTLQAGTNYFWLTYDVPNGATVGDFVDAECNSLTVGSPFVPTIQAPAGNRQITCAALCGTYSIPSAQFPTIASAITALNASGIACSVVFNVAAGYTETAANLIINPSATGNSGATVTFQKSGAGANPKINAGVGVSTLYDAFIILNGVSYYTFDGIDLAENPGNVTTTTQMEFGYWLARPSGTQGCQNNTIKNCNITMNKTNTATYGIYSTTQNSLGVAQTVTNATGANSNNSFLSNNITNSYSGIYVVGYSDVSPYSLYDQNLTINNTGSGASSVTNFSLYGIYSYYQTNPTISNTTINSTGGVNSAGSLYGIYNYNSINGNCNITGNTVTLVTTGTTSYLYCIYNYFLYGNNVNINNNTVQNCSNPTTGAYYCYYIYNTSGSTVNNLTMSGNRVIGNNYGTAALATGGTYNIYNNTSYLNSITITNNLDSGNTVLGSTASVVYDIYNGVTTNYTTITGNSVKNNTICGTTSANTIYGIYNSSGSITCTYDNNTVSNNSLPTTSSASMYFMYNTSPAPTSDYSNNTVNANTSTGAGTFYCLYHGGAIPAGGTVTIATNNIQNNSKTTATGTGSIYSLYQAGSGAGTYNISGNLVNNQTSAAATLLAGIYQIGSPPNYVNILNNTVSNLTNGGATTIYGIYNFPTSTTQSVESQNTVTGITSPGSTIYGMYFSTHLAITLSRNRIYGITSNTSTTATVYGIYDADAVAGNVYIYNNYVSDINAPASTSIAPAVCGIYIPSGIATTNVNVYYNTVFLKATSSSVTTFGTAALYATTTPVVDLRNNVLVDLSTPGPTGGVACAYRRSSTIMTSYANTSNNNCLYAGAPSANHLVYYDATNLIQTLANYKTFANPRDNVSVTENPPFVNASVTPYDLHIQNSIATQLESGGQVISSPISITTDWDGQNRYPNAGYPVGGYAPTNPDIGADEFGGLYLDLVPPFISYTALGNGGTTNRAFTNVTITDGTGVNTTSGTRPRCYYKRSTDGNTIIDNTSGTDGWKWVETNGTTNQFDFTIDYSKLNGGTGVVSGNIVQYFVIAQDIVGTPNVGWNQATFASIPSSVNLAAVNCPINGTLQYNIVANVFSGGYDVGTGWTYPTLTGAGGLFSAINSGVVGGNITAYIHTDITEPGTFALNTTNETGPGGYNITIVPFDASMKTISGSVAGGMIIFNGVKRITIDGNGGFPDNPQNGNLTTGKGNNLNDNNNKGVPFIEGRSVNGGKDTPGGTKYLTFRNTNGANPTFIFQNDAIKNTLTNCYIESNNITTTSGTIFFSTTTVANGNGNDSNTISYCDIRDRSDAAGTPCNGIYSNGTTTTVQTYNSYNTISNCNIYNYYYDASASEAGVYLNSGTTDWVITGNSFYQTVARSPAVNASIFASIYNNISTNTNNIQITNNYIGGTAPQCGGTPMTYTCSSAPAIYAIQAFVAVLGATNITGNTIKNMNLTWNSATGNANGYFKGIYAQTGWINVNNNTIGATTGTGNITLTINTTATSETLTMISMGIGTTFGNCNNNTIGSITIGGSETATGDLYAMIYSSNTVSGQTYSISNNLIGSLTTPNSIQVTNLVNAHALRGMYLLNGATTTNNINNNTVMNLTSLNTSSVNFCHVYGIQENNQVNANYTFTGNTISNLTANSNVGIASYELEGISSLALGVNTFSQNVISSLYANGSGSGYALVGGIIAGGSTGGTVSRNKMYDFRFNGTGSTTVYPLLIGINTQGPALSSPTYNISNNQIDLTNGDPSDHMLLKEPESMVFHKDVITENTPLINPLPKNFKQDQVADKTPQYNSILVTDPVNCEYDKNTEEYRKLKNNNFFNSKVTGNQNNVSSKFGNGEHHDNATINTSIAGIYQTTTSNTANYNYYYNSIYIGGTQPGSSLNSWAFLRANSGGAANTSTANTFLRNNLLVNARTGGSANHFVIGNEGLPSTTGWSSTASNYNVLLGSNSATIGEWTLNNPQTLAQWVASSNGEKQTWSTTTATINPLNLFTNISGGDLSIQTGNTEAWLVRGKGIAVSGQSVDYFGSARATTISAGCTNIGAHEFAGSPPITLNNATVDNAPGSGVTSTYTLWGRTMCIINWGTGGTSYPTSMSINYYSGINPSNVLGGNYSNSHTNIAVRTGSFSGTTYTLTYYMGDNETYTISTPSTNTILAKYDPSSWEVFQPGNGNYQTQLTWSSATETYTAKVIGIPGFSDFALTDATSALPVQICSFTGGALNRDITLNWTTCREINNKGFDIERRMQTDAQTNTFSEWARVSYVDGHGTTNEQQNYSFKDVRLSVGKFQYRLKQIDYNGNTEYYNLTSPSLVEIGKPGNAEIGQNYPNPSNPKSKIDYQIPFNGKVSLKVYDLVGREVATIVNEVKDAGFYTAEFDGTNLASGVYLYRILAEGEGQKFIQTKKMVLVK